MMINRIVVLAAFGALVMALVMALVACAASESEYEQTAESEVMEYRSADAPMAAAAPAPVQQQFVTAQPEGFNTIGGSATVNDDAYDLTFFKHYGSTRSSTRRTTTCPRSR